MNGLGKNKTQQRDARSDDIFIKICKNNKNNDVICEGGGSWLSHLVIDNKVFWKIEDPIPKWKNVDELDENLLQSDTKFRLEIGDLID